MDVALAIADLLKNPENKFGNFAVAENRRNMDSLLSELERIKKKSDWLARMNDLHGRLAGAVDMNSMLEAFSVWLMPFVEHDLLGYNHIERRRGHMFCSCHGPERRQVLKAAEKTFAYVKEQDDSVEWRVDDFWIRIWLYISILGERNKPWRLFRPLIFRTFHLSCFLGWDNVYYTISFYLWAV